MDENIVTIKSLKLGETFKLLSGSKAVYVRQHYDPTSERYSVSRWDDINAERFLKGTTKVNTKFQF